jgi:mannose-1-phosphate guanylyltransferase
LWNTMVVGGRAATLWELGRRLLPDVIEELDRVRPRLRGIDPASSDAVRLEASILEGAYDRLRAADFSADFLARAVDSTLVFPLEDLLWSDWGRPKRVMQSIQELGLDAPARLARAF